MKVNDLGILEYYTNSKGISGVFKSFPEDFVVQEITPRGEICTLKYPISERVNDLLFRFKKPRKYVRATLVKRDYPTIK